MGAPVVDLAVVRQHRDAAIRLGRVMAEKMVGSIVESIHRWAGRAEAISGPLLATDAEAARALNLWAARRLRAEVKRTLVDIPPEAKADMVETADTAFWDVLISLADQRAKGCGR